MEKINLIQMSKLKSVLFVLVIALLVAVAIRYSIQRFEVPDFPGASSILYDSENNQLSLRNYRGKVIIVSFFQTWCGDCRRELPELQALQMAVGGKENLEVILITDESWDKINAVKQYLKTDLPFFQSSKKLKELGIRRFPTTYLLDKKGSVAEAKVEGINWNTPELQQQIKKLNE